MYYLTQAGHKIKVRIINKNILTKTVKKDKINIQVK